VLQTKAANAEGRDTNSLNGNSLPQMDMARQLDIKDIAKKLLSESKDSEENLKRIQAARLRVAEAQAAKEELAQAMRAEAFEARLQEAQRAQSTQSQLADVELRMAQARLAEAKIAQLEAERDEEKWAQAINEESEKAESLKAGAIAAVAGTLACLPLTVTNADSPVVGVLSTFTFTASCLLLGVVYRYALRQDLGNSQLKGGVVAAFGLVRGLAIADSLQTSVGGELTAELVAKVSPSASPAVPSLLLLFPGLDASLRCLNLSLQAREGIAPPQGLKERKRESFGGGGG